MSAHRQFGCQFGLAFGILLVIMLTNPTVGIAQSYDTLPGDDSPLSCRFRANVPRCEGMYRYRVVASAQVEILRPVEHEQGAFDASQTRVKGWQARSAADRLAEWR